MEFNHEPLSIKQWAEDDRPREKLISKGRNALSDAELIAILIGSGTRNESAVELSKKILGSVQNDINILAKLNVEELKRFNGIGEAKAVTIVAALELGRRRKRPEKAELKKITSSKDAYELMQTEFSDLKHEEFWVAYFNRANALIQKVNISKGGVAGTVADSKIIFKKGIDLLASSIILFHNHPSGNLKPSQADIDLTKKMVEAGKTLEIPVLDHIVCTDNGYYSFADEGMI